MVILNVLVVLVIIFLISCAVVFIAPLFMLDFRNGDECHECIGCPYAGNDHCEDNCYIYKRFKRYVKRYKKRAEREENKNKE